MTHPTAVQGHSATGILPPRYRMAAIVNPATHGDANAIIALLRRHMPAEVTLDVHLTPAANTAMSLARAALTDGADTLIAVGGDGTVAEVATALQGTSVPLGIIPGGSTNITARELGIPGHPAEAIALLFDAHRHTPLDIGVLKSSAGETLFLHMAGAGLDSALFGDADSRLKRRFGWLGYLSPTLHDIVRPPIRFTVIADGVTHEVTSPLVLVANGGSIINPHLTLSSTIQADDGWLDVLIFTPRTPSEMLRTLGRAATGSVDCSPFVQHLRARQIELSADPPLPVERDGDVVSQTPVQMTLLPAAVRVIVPPQRHHLLESTSRGRAAGEKASE